jgi:hypothetical protein
MQNIPSHFLKDCSRKLLALLLIISSSAMIVKAQDSTAAVVPEVKKKSYTKNTFSSNYLIDEQTVMVPIKGTLEFYIMHRFGTVNEGISNFFGVFEQANMRFAFTYVPIKDLQIGFGFGNFNITVDGNVKYAILKETRDHSMPVSVTYYGLMAMNTTKATTSNYIVTTSDRFSYFNQILIARKITDKFSIQAGIAITHFNNVPGYVDSSGKTQSQMQNNNWTFCAGGRYQITPGMAFIVNYDQPLTQNVTSNPQPNISFGLDMSTSGHDFQIFAGNYGYVLPTDNTVFNQNNFRKGQFVIGFNISRLWNF